MISKQKRMAPAQRAKLEMNLDLSIFLIEPPFEFAQNIMLERGLGLGKQFVEGGVVGDLALGRGRILGGRILGGEAPDDEGELVEKRMALGFAHSEGGDVPLEEDLDVIQEDEGSSFVG